MVNGASAMSTLHKLSVIPAFVTLLSLPLQAEYFLDADTVTPGSQPGSKFVPVTAPTGTVDKFSEGWEKLTSTQNPGVSVGFPGSGTWQAVAYSHVGLDAPLNSVVKTGNGFGGLGGPYPASASIYYGGMSSVPNLDGGELTFAASGAGVLPALKTVVFQIDIGEAWTYDLYNNVAPVLHYTSTTTSGTISASFSSLYKETANGTVTMPSGDEPLNINSRAYQFNLSGLGTITGFTITFRGVQHAQLYGAGLQQFDAAASTSLLRPNVN